MMSVCPVNPQGNLWKRKGWAEMDKMRAKLEDLKELRDLVRSLGRGGGWGPLRRAPIQYLDMKVCAGKLAMNCEKSSFLRLWVFSQIKGLH